jgi:hypothetical protein
MLSFSSHYKGASVQLYNDEYVWVLSTNGLAAVVNLSTGSLSVDKFYLHELISSYETFILMSRKLIYCHKNYIKLLLRLSLVHLPTNSLKL